MHNRRTIMKLGYAGLAAASMASSAVAQQQPSPMASVGEGQPFDFQNVQASARALASRPYQAVSAPLPDVLSNLNAEDFSAIRMKREFFIWTGESTGFAIEPLHRGYVFSAPVALFTVEDGIIRRMTYQQSRFNFGKLNVPDNQPDLGFSGFRIHVTNVPGLEDVAVFQGASFFRARARGQVYGIQARALAVRTADPKGEEFPFFRAFWIEKPSPGSDAIVVSALADSESVAAAFRFTIRPGDATIIDTEAVLFPRTAIDHIGYAPMQGTYLLGPNSRRISDDLRPKVSECEGLQMFNGRDEWLWRPLQNPENLQVSSFVDENPHGFGLMQRDRDPASYFDSDQRWEARPSLWIEPLGDWSQGSVQLVEIPSDSDVNDNIIAYWRPRGTLAVGKDISLAYRQTWGWSAPETPPLAIVGATRIGRATGRNRRILVEFSGKTIAALKLVSDVTVMLSAGPGKIINPRYYLDSGRETFRVLFDFDANGEPASEMRLQLQANGKPISETWLYRWTP